MFTKEKQEVLDSIQSHNALRIYANLTEDQKADQDIAIKVFSYEGLAIRFAPESIQNNSKACLVACRNTALAVCLTPYRPSLERVA